MFKKNEDTGKKMYPVHCTECGDVIDGKFFPLDNLMKQYAPGEGISAQRDEMIRVLGIGALYGKNILPDVPQLLYYQEETEETPGIWYVVRPNLSTLRQETSPLSCFACKDNNDIPMDRLVGVNLNVASMIAQFCISTGFDEIYDMLEIQNRIEQKANVGELPSEEDENRLRVLCQQFAMLPGVQLSRMTAAGMQDAQIVSVLSIILSFAREEADAGRQNYASETLMVGWRYQLINGIQMPHSLVVVGATSREANHCNKCCCDKCRRELPTEMGAYPQRIIGILGTQATGKTTYLAALANAIDVGEATTYTQSNGDQQYANIKIDHNANDPQWKRVQAEPHTDASGESKIGALWLYQNGYPPQKTKPEALEAPALTFLITGAKGTTMYTLADIAGEAFTKDDRYEQYLDKMRKLLYSSDALMMVISTGQMDNGSKAEVNQKLILNPSEILTYYKDFLPNRPIPTAVVMTSADKINAGDLRQPLNLAYDIRKCRPLVWDGRRNHLVYNVEAMATSVQAVWVYINKYFGTFMENLFSYLKKSGKQEPKVAAFAVSSGTQCAPHYFGDDVDEAYNSDEQRKERYAQMRQNRFGITAPFLWLLACDEMLEIGRVNTEYNDYTNRIQTAIADLLKKRL